MIPVPRLTVCPWCSTPLQEGTCYVCQVQWQPVSPFELPPPASYPPAVAPTLAAPRAPSPRAPPYRPPSRTVPGAPVRRALPPPGARKRPSPASSGLKGAYRRVIRYFPPVRLVWIFLTVLIYLQGILSSSAGEGVFLTVMGLSVGLDLAIQYGRFAKFRIPDAALAIGAFLVILIQPAAVDLVLLSVTVCTIVIRHALRYHGHPWFNPTAMGLTVGFFLFGLAVPWSVGKVTFVDPYWVVAPYVSLNELVMVLFGIALILRQRNSWRYVFYFFVSVVPLLILSPLAAGASLTSVIPTEATFFQNILSSLILFYGFFMVTEPRTSPASPKHVWIFSLVVAALFVSLTLLFNEYPVELGPLGSITPFLALFGGNLFTLFLRMSQHLKPTRKPAARSVPAWDQGRYGSGGMPTFAAWPPPSQGGWGDYPPWPGGSP